MSNEINKEIEELTNAIDCPDEAFDTYWRSHCERLAVLLYEQGYRKQSEGCDFCKAGNEKCGTCVKFFDYYEDGGSDRCITEYGNEKCAYYKPVHHCSSCGARIKGGE